MPSAAPSALAKKLQLEPGHRALLLAAPPGYARWLEPLPQDIQVLGSSGGGNAVDFAQQFVRNRDELERVHEATEAVKRGGRLWISYPKKSGSIPSDLDRDTLREALADLGWNAVALVALDDDWSAMRICPAEEAAT